MGSTDYCYCGLLLTTTMLLKRVKRKTLMTNFRLDPGISHRSNTHIMNFRFRICLYCFLARLLGADMPGTMPNIPPYPTMSIMDNIHLDLIVYSMGNYRVGRHVFQLLYFK